MPKDKSKKYGVKPADASPYVDLDLPSGGLVQVRRPRGVQGLVKAGVLDDFDTLTAASATTVANVDGGSTSKPPTGKQVRDALAAMDRIVTYVVIQPALHPVPDDDADRDPDLTYLDDMGELDKAVVVNFALSGTRDLEPFRTGSAAALAGVPTGT